ncbi:protein adenylyltransferase SelO-like isoform X2 [Rousettus aegyptiacus]|uniref:protein adenylyltransferase SelO-like isoform X2 n=1 Tax=Rousettus aegyptiacus TaxID=9407 RepID=UPI00168CC408|nr:protein adenylyltransferase SelO-like isoform X2 [Rousettus aegyptiacus]
MLRGARPPATNFCSVYLGRDTTPRVGFPFRSLIRRLPFPRLLLQCLISHAVVGSFVQPGLEGSASLLHLFNNKSSQEQSYCETESRLASSLDFWTLSSENLIAVLPVDPVKENYVRKVRNCIFSIAFPTPFKSRVRLVAVSKEVLEDILDLDLSISETDAFIQLVSGEKIVSGSIPLTHRYGGHQFGIWADQLGDGRAHLIGIYKNRQGEKWELQLKGSGKTPYSRNGDGRAVLRSSVREFLCSEAMYHLGIPTSRAASLAVSDDEVWRDQFYNGNITKERGAVVLRVAKSWFRIGSLEILAHYGELDLLRTLLDFIIQEHFPSVDVKEPNRYVDFFSIVVSETAQLIALWMSVGFAHGVCNTDNFSLLSITIDYGPFGFMEAYNPDFVPNTSDDERRYKIGNQANIGMFNLNKLLQALNPLLDPGQKQLFRELFKAKLGLLGERKGDDDLIAFLLHLMEETEADFTMTFRQLGEITQSQLQELDIPQQFWALKMISKHKLFPAWASQYLLRLKSNMNDSDSERRKRMTTVNPRYVLKNWMAESAVQKAERNDFSEVHLLQHVLQHPFQMHSAAEKAGYASPTPSWAKDLRVSCSS